MTNTDLPKQSKAQVLEEFGKPFQLKDVETPTPSSEHEVIVRVEAAGYCHTDSVLAAGEEWGGPTSLPHIGGHEFVGTVVALHGSPSTVAKELGIGTRVGIPCRGFAPCGVCFECSDPSNEEPGYSFFCKKAGQPGLTRDGGWADYALVDARQCISLPSALASVDAAPLMCAGITIYQAIKRCELSAGQRLGIMGAGGGLGHLGLQFAEAMGLRVTAIDASDGALSLVKGLGTRADIIDARAVTADELRLKIAKEDNKADAGDIGLDGVIILPESQAAFDYGVKLLRNHSICVAVSIPVKGWHVSSFDLVWRDVTVKGTLLGSKATISEMVQFAAKHNVKPVKKTFSLAQLNDLVEEMHKGLGGKLVVDNSKS